jgi:agmatine/peptidylarginine deiminase
MRLIAQLVAAAVTLLAPPGQGARQCARLADFGYGVVITRSEKPDRLLNGDADDRESIAVVYTEAWEEELAQVIEHASTATHVVVLAPESRQEEIAAWVDGMRLGRHGATVLEAPFDTPWIRDYGPRPTTESDGTVVWLDAQYGVDRERDDAIPARLASHFGVTLEAMPEQLDGGALISNGLGLCVSTLAAFNEAEIPFDDTGYMERLLGQLGCRALALVPALLHDPTKHADMLATFLARDVVAVADVVSQAPLPEMEDMDRAAELIAEAAKLLDMPLRIVRVPLPTTEDGTYYTYLNSVRIGDLLLAPSYAAVDPELESRAVLSLARSVGITSIAAIPATTVLESRGSVHCLTADLALPVERPAHRQMRSLGSVR